MDAQHGRVYSASYLEKQRTRLLDELQAQGQVRLDAMARQIQISIELLQNLIYQLV